MKFASYNIQFGLGLDRQFDPERIARSLEGADVIALQEVTRGMPHNGGVDLVSVMADLFPDHHFIYGPACDLHLSSERVDGRLVDKRYQFGNMVLSRWPILAHRMLLLPRHRTFDKLNLQRGATEAVIATPDGPLRVYSVHLDHVSPDERIDQIDFLKERVLNFVNEGGAITGATEFGVADPPLPEDFLILGDFNMEPESPEYCAMTGHGDASYGRVLRAGFPVDALARCGAVTADSVTWIDCDNHAERKHLDYCFLSPGLVPRLKDAFIDIEAEGSDHLPIWVELG